MLVPIDSGPSSGSSELLTSIVESAVTVMLLLYDWLFENDVPGVNITELGIVVLVPPGGVYATRSPLPPVPW